MGYNMDWNNRAEAVTAPQLQNIGDVFGNSTLSILEGLQKASARKQEIEESRKFTREINANQRIADKENIKIKQRYALGNIELQNKYAIDREEASNGNALDRMEIQNGYDVEAAKIKAKALKNRDEKGDPRLEFEKNKYEYKLNQDRIQKEEQSRLVDSVMSGSSASIDSDVYDTYQVDGEKKFDNSGRHVNEVFTPEVNKTIDYNESIVSKSKKELDSLMKPTDSILKNIDGTESGKIKALAEYKKLLEKKDGSIEDNSMIYSSGNDSEMGNSSTEKSIISDGMKKLESYISALNQRDSYLSGIGKQYSKPTLSGEKITKKRLNIPETVKKAKANVASLNTRIEALRMSGGKDKKTIGSILSLSKRIKTEQKKIDKFEDSIISKRKGANEVSVEAKKARIVDISNKKKLITNKKIEIEKALDSNRRKELTYELGVLEQELRDTEAKQK